MLRLLLPVSLVLAAAPPQLHANDLYARGAKAAVVSAHPLASEVGLQVLKEGGNAVDAAVAVGFALAVVHPQAGNLGGGGFALLFQANGESLALDFRERAPARAHRDMYLDKDGKVLRSASLWTAKAAGVPGSPKGLCHLHAKHGSKPLPELLAPAIRLAKQGFVVDHFLSSAIHAKRKILGLWKESSRVFLPNGHALAQGSVLQQPELARTLERIAEHGDAGFYEGPVAEALVAAMRRHKGLIDLADLKQYHVVERKVLRGSYRGHPVLAMPPPSSGGVAVIQMLHFVEPFDLGRLGFGSARGLHLRIEAMRRAFADRAKWLGDPDFFPVPVAGLIDKDYVAKRRQDFDWERATPGLGAGQPKGAPKIDDPQGVRRESKDTTHYSIVDAAGNAVSITTTINSSFGNGQLVPGAGFLLNNEMDDFSAKPGVPNQFGLVGAKANEIQPGKRPLSSMSPTIVLSKDGKRPLLILGSPGGSRIINTTFQVILNVLDHQMPIRQAVPAPRIHHQFLPPALYWEPLALPQEVRAALLARGHSIQDKARIIGRCQAIWLPRPGRVEAMADPRSGGAAKAW
ncbi:MAG: gamma-glutamyltransferase [Planctomycetota bacterium]|nr:MAG: gamma-glutamyltransferase [Planctomycetota bacterium]